MADDFVGMGGGSGEPPKKHDAKSPVRRDSSISLDDPIPLAEQYYFPNTRRIVYGSDAYAPHLGLPDRSSEMRRCCRMAKAAMNRPRAP
jgi:hypothetical protein